MSSPEDWCHVVGEAGGAECYQCCLICSSGKHGAGETVSALTCRYYVSFDPTLKITPQARQQEVTISARPFGTCLSFVQANYY